MRDRIFGLETEYGCLAPEDKGFVSPDAISVRVKDFIFHSKRSGIIDIHYRGRDEPRETEGFYTTPAESTSIWDTSNTPRRNAAGCST